MWPLLAWDWCDRDTLFLMQAKIKKSFPLRTVKLLILHSVLSVCSCYYVPPNILLHKEHSVSYAGCAISSHTPCSPAAHAFPGYFWGAGGGFLGRWGSWGQYNIGWAPPPHFIDDGGGATLRVLHYSARTTCSHTLPPL